MTLDPAWNGSLQAYWVQACPFDLVAQSFPKP